MNFESRLVNTGLSLTLELAAVNLFRKPKFVFPDHLRQTFALD
jgi:hypothetical protein